MADIEEYNRAAKLGQKAIREARIKNQYPYLPALDEIISTSQIKTETPMGLMDIPLDQIVGTKTAGRQQAFAANFMPIMPGKSEFAMKWLNVYDYQLNEGVGDPIVCYEYLNNYYVLEGNKRVSVLKYLHAYSIEGNVTRIVPRMSSDPQIKISYEYMEFYRKSGINYLYFSKEGSFGALTRLCGIDENAMWTDEQKQDFSSSFLRFQKIFRDMGGKKLRITAGDAFVFYLGLYPYAELSDKADALIRSELEKIWKEFGVIEEDPAEALVMAPEDTAEAGLFTRFFAGTGSTVLKVAFIHDKPIEDSSWIYGHELARGYLEDTFGNKIRTSSYCLTSSDESKLALLEKAIADGNHILFTTSGRLQEASLKCAIDHPEVKILNCAINRPYQAIRTYFGRMYEVKFLEGIVAGTHAVNDRIAYQADFPIYGAIANINAFALGVRMTNPRAKVYLNWTGKSDQGLDCMIQEKDIHVVADFDAIRPGFPNRRYGLYHIDEGRKITNLAAPIWHWGKFYEKILRDILSGSWGTQEKERRAMRYLWGISGEIVDLVVSQNLSPGVQDLIGILRQQIICGSLRPFDTAWFRQDGSPVNPDGSGMSIDQILKMDWLCDNVVGAIPEMDELSEEGKSLVKLQLSTGTVEDT